MKTLFKFYYYLFLLLASMMLACQDEENKSGTGEIQFAINDLLQNSSGRTTAALPDGASLLISIEDASGNAVFTLKKLDLLSFGSQYTSAPLKLENGDYKLTDFLIVDETNAVAYATPHAGSSFASLVTRPLPVSFSITTGKSTSVPTQVVRANEATPEDFGYATFPVSIVAYPEFAVSVFAFRVGELRLTSAQAYLLHEGDTIYRKYLNPETSDIVFKGEQDETYTFVLVRPGFAKYSRTFVLSELREELDDEPLEIILQQAVTMTIIPDGLEQFSIFLSGVSGKEVIIDWGDGTMESQTLSNFIPEDFNAFEYTHTYEDPELRPYFVSLTGDIDAIEEMAFGWTGGPTDLALQNAVNLVSFRLNFNFGLENIDLSENQKLEMLGVGFAYDVKSINLGNNKRISYLSLEELPALPASEVDKIIDNIYQNVVAAGGYPGTLNIRSIDEEGNQVLMGPPSPESLEKLYTLRDEYSWSFDPALP